MLNLATAYLIFLLADLTELTIKVALVNLLCFYTNIIYMAVGTRCTSHIWFKKIIDS